MRRLKILIVEDDPLMRKLIEGGLREHSVDFAADADSGRRKIAESRRDICFLDLKLGAGDDKSGLELVPMAAESGAYCVVMSGHDSEAVVERAYELGCDDFYAKGNEEQNVGAVVARYLRRCPDGCEDRLFEDLFVTEDAATRAAVGEAVKYAASELPIMILGPSGTGKTSLAEVIHGRSGRRGQFVAINCAAYTEDLLEAELFGYRKGAFTGAGDGRKGKLLLADGGTLFLDEIGSMSLSMQAKLLKAIEEKSFHPLGSDSVVRSRFRVVSATWENLDGLVKRNRLRFDFLHRVQGLSVELKPLARRKGDVLPLISFFTRGGRRLAFTAEAKKEVLAYSWPGNVRELKRFVDIAAAGEPGRVEAESVRRFFSTAQEGETADEFVEDRQYRHVLEHGLRDAIERFEDDVIRRSLADNDGRKNAVMSALKIDAALLSRALERRGKRGGERDGK